MNNPVNHHYLPVFYMSRWTSTDKQVCRFSRPDGLNVIARRKFPRKFAYEEHLYGPLELSQLKQLDDQGAKALQFLEASPSVFDMPTKLRKAWAKLLLSFLLRSPTNIHQLKHSISSEYEKEFKRLNELHRETLNTLGYSSVETYITDHNGSDLEYKVFEHVGNLLEHEGIVRVLSKMHWQVLDLENPDLDLLTSDNPVWMTEDLGHSDSFLTLPISPQLLFVGAHSKSTINTLKERPKSDLVNTRNKITVQHAVNLVVGTDDRMLDFISEHFATRRYSTLAELLAKQRGLPILDTKSP